MRPEDFDDLYAGTPPWEIGRPQAAFVAAAQAGLLRGAVLDVGCGTGELALLAASLGLEAIGIDLAPTAVAIARRRATERGLAARFLVHDATQLGALGTTFETVLDSGMFHVLSDRDRARFVDGLRTVLTPGGRYLVLCFSDQVPGDLGPRRISREELRAAFQDGFRVEAIEPAAIEASFDEVVVPAWFATILRRRRRLPS